MGVIKLPAVGDEATFVVASCQQVEGKFGPQVVFTSEQDETLYLPKDSADRQLARAFDWTADNEPDYGSVVGSRIRVFREPNTKKPGGAPFWAVEIASGPPKAPSKRLSGPASHANPPGHDPSAPPATEPPAGDPDPGWDFEGERDAAQPAIELGSPVIDAVIAKKREAIGTAYAWAYDTAWLVQSAQASRDGAPRPTADSVQAGAATLLIAASNRGAI